MAAGTVGDVGALEVLPLSVAGAAEQLGRTETLLRDTAVPGAPATLRWYSYDAPALVLGVGQTPAVVDEAACLTAGVNVVKRTSGGAVVLAGPTLLALDVALPAAHPLAVGDVIEAYRWVGETFRDALASLAPPRAGQIALVNVATARADQQMQRAAPAETIDSLRALACFGVLSPYEVGLWRPSRIVPAKLVGLSQIRRRGVVLFQAGVYTSAQAGEVGLGHLPDLLALPMGVRKKLSRELVVGAAASLDDLGLDRGVVPQLIAEFNAAATRRLSAAGRTAAAGR